MSSQNRVSAYIIAFNEAEKIVAAVRSLGWADEIIVADSGSTDGMIGIAEALGAQTQLFHGEVDSAFGLVPELPAASTISEWRDEIHARTGS